MNRNEIRVPARFGPETRFEVRPAPRCPFGPCWKPSSNGSKTACSRGSWPRRRAELNPPLRRAANEAAALAWETVIPLLVFPVLFEEKIEAALRHAARQACIRESSLELLVV